MLTIDIGDSAAAVKKFMEDNHFSFPVLLDSRVTVAQTYALQGTPTTFFIDKEGIIRTKVIGFVSKEGIENNINEIMP